MILNSCSIQSNSPRIMNTERALSYPDDNKSRKRIRKPGSSLLTTERARHIYMQVNRKGSKGRATLQRSLTKGQRGSSRGHPAMNVGPPEDVLLKRRPSS